MLIVSRKENQSVVFPSLGISVDIIRISGRTVKVGVKAPDDIRILRGELADTETRSQSPVDPPVTDTLSQKELRQRLHQANIALRLMKKQLACGQINDAEETLAIALKAFASLEQSADQTVANYRMKKKLDSGLMEFPMPRSAGDEAVRESRVNYQFDGDRRFLVSGNAHTSTPVPDAERGIWHWLQPDALAVEIMAALN